MRLLPEFRKASKQMSVSVKFGTVDCTVHVGLCQQVRFISLSLLVNSVAFLSNGQYLVLLLLLLLIFFCFLCVISSQMMLMRIVVTACTILELYKYRLDTCGSLLCVRLELLKTL